MEDYSDEDFEEVEEDLEEEISILNLKNKKDIYKNETIFQKILKTVPENILRTELKKEEVNKILNKDLIFQAVSWSSSDIDVTDQEDDVNVNINTNTNINTDVNTNGIKGFKKSSSSTSSNDDGPVLKYQIFIHGIIYNESDYLSDNKSSISTCIRLVDFNPYFYVEVPPSYNELDAQKLFNYYAKKCLLKKQLIINQNQ